MEISQFFKYMFLLSCDISTVVFFFVSRHYTPYLSPDSSHSGGSVRKPICRTVTLSPTKSAVTDRWASFLFFLLPRSRIRI